MDLKLINQLKFGKTSGGRIGTQVKPTGENPNNKAWLTVIMSQNTNLDGSDEINSYEVEYLELDEAYSEELHGLDYDLFYVKKETFYNIKIEKELEALLIKWLPNLNVLRPVAQISHPYF